MVPDRETIVHESIGFFVARNGRQPVAITSSHQASSSTAWIVSRSPSCGRKPSSAEARLAEGFATGSVSAETLTNQMAAVRHRKQEVEASLAANRVDVRQLRRSVNQKIALITSVADIFRSVSLTRRAELLRQLFEPVVLSASGIDTHALRPPCAELVRTRQSRSKDNARRSVETLLSVDA